MNDANIATGNMIKANAELLARAADAIFHADSPAALSLATRAHTFAVEHTTLLHRAIGTENATRRGEVMLLAEGARRQCVELCRRARAERKGQA